MMMQGDIFWVERFFTSLFDTAALHVHSQKIKYRNKITYSLPLQKVSELAEDRINDVCRAVQNWHQDDSVVIFREVMVKATRQGKILVRVTVQHQNTCRWDAEAFRHHLVTKFPAIECLCYNVANSSARPSKESAIHVLTDAVYVLETTPNGLDYQIGSDTFSEVNHEVEWLQWAKTKEWLDEIHADGRADSAVLIVSGRDISSFGLGFGSLLNENGDRMFSHTVAIQHCPLVHQDALENFGRHRDKVDATVLHMTKPDMVHGFSQELERHSGRPVVGVMTGGRKGLDPLYIQYLVNNPSVVCIVYNSCSTKSLLRDMKGFLDGGFFVDDFKSYDFLPGTGYTASLTKLIRRPRTLVIPVGPAGAGKSSVAKELVANTCASVVWLERDAVFASLRNQEIGLAKSKQMVHQYLLDCLRKPGDTAVIFLDSTNGKSDARKLYVHEAFPDLAILVLFQVDGDNVVDFLLDRTANRLKSNEALHPSFPDTVDEQRKKHVKILKGICYPTPSNEDLGVRTTCLFCNPRDNDDMANLPYSVFLEFTTSGKLRHTVKPT